MRKRKRNWSCFIWTMESGVDDINPDIKRFERSNSRELNTTMNKVNNLIWYFVCYTIFLLYIFLFNLHSPAFWKLYLFLCTWGDPWVPTHICATRFFIDRNCFSLCVALRVALILIVVMVDYSFSENPNTIVVPSSNFQTNSARYCYQLIFYQI